MIRVRRVQLWVGAALLTMLGIAAATFLRASPGPQVAPEPITLSTTALLGESQAGISIGSLSVVDAAVWQSTDPRFGGWSGARWAPNGDLIAVSDQGYWLRVRNGAASMGVLRDAEANPLPSKQAADAEGLALLPDGRAVVSFEGRHRLDIYALGSDGFAAPARPGPALAGLNRLARNSGLEALALLPDGRLVAGAETGEVWVTPVDNYRPAPLNQRVPLPLGWGLTAFAAMDTHLFMVWRFFNPLTQEAKAEVRRCDLDGLDAPPLHCESLGTLSAPFPTDNYEAIEVSAIGSGYRLTLMSDNNYNRRQRTIVTQLDWIPISTGPPPPASVR